jgi:hypothetical protein
MFFFNSLSQEKTKTTTDIICHANQYFAEITKNANIKTLLISHIWAKSMSKMSKILIDILSLLSIL